MSVTKVDNLTTTVVADLVAPVEKVWQHASIERRTVWSLISSNRWSRADPCAPWSSGTHL